MSRHAWMDQAICAQTDPDLFTGAAISKATATPKRVCTSCPVADECAAYERTIRDHDGEPLAGIWGGLSQRQRTAAHSQQAA
ncbi:WhiB family transcriptional regulator [Streptomyces sp. NBC_00140]|uniref:WhiB family transcriptional regulator n=1 Tax=Streptomyces sp. NBC_00140 TaxID=2975664 RepID=UPI002250EAA1|nr:WhiB family transcriptional regulator [Streptomyces sp. NBC_00140]MCX5336938.1 WhiB family transcriptional regulator [Streptomyces sp. NBC_00140]MCX5338421.1 WhiB family transcriptional regulator [Streptomyces sp. NBC_00140]